MLGPFGYFMILIDAYTRGGAMYAYYLQGTMPL
jgi:hypothetical protein